MPVSSSLLPKSVQHASTVALRTNHEANTVKFRHFGEPTLSAHSEIQRPLHKKPTPSSVPWKEFEEVASIGECPCTCLRDVLANRLALEASARTS